jgi:hypothetical protein
MPLTYRNRKEKRQTLQREGRKNFNTKDAKRAKRKVARQMESISEIWRRRVFESMTSVAV